MVGSELLANVWGSAESLEGMNAFVEKRKPDFQQFRRNDKELVDDYLAGVVRGKHDQ